MATRTITNINAVEGNQVSDFDLSAFGAGSEPGANFMRHIKDQLNSTVAGRSAYRSFSYTLGTTLDDNENTIANGDIVQCRCGFEPKFAVVYNNNGSGSGAASVEVLTGSAAGLVLTAAATAFNPTATFGEFYLEVKAAYNANAGDVVSVHVFG